MKIGVIGCGYVGQAITQFWKQKKYFLSVTTRNYQRVQILEKIADQVFLLENQSLKDFISCQNVIIMSVAPDTSKDYRCTYLNVAEQIAKSSLHLDQIIYTSSTSLYGDHGGKWVNESTPITPYDEKSRILFETEQVLLQSISNHLKVCVFRLGEIYGPGREIENRLKMGKKMAGDGKPYTNLIHIEDIVNALDFALQHRLNGIYNLCNDLHIPRFIFYEQLCKKYHIPFIQWNTSISPPFSGNKRVSNQKIKDAGFIFSNPSYDLENNDLANCHS